MNEYFFIIRLIRALSNFSPSEMTYFNDFNTLSLILYLIQNRNIVGFSVNLVILCSSIKLEKVLISCITVLGIKTVVFPEKKAPNKSHSLGIVLI